MRKERRKLERDAPRCAAPVKTISFAVTQQVTPAGLSYSALSTLTRFLAQRCISDTGHRWPIHLQGTMCNCGVVRSTESLTKTVTDSLVGFSLRMFNTFIPSNRRNQPFDISYHNEYWTLTKSYGKLSNSCWDNSLLDLKVTFMPATDEGLSHEEALSGYFDMI